MKNILFIAYEFPPLNVGGSARPAKFAKHLNRFGYNPIVVTLNPDDYDKVFSSVKTDSNILDDYSGKLKIINVSSEDLVKRRRNKYKRALDIYFNIYKEAYHWKENFNKMVNQVLREREVSAIFVTAPPFSILKLAAKTAKKFDLPLIVDMRDPWTMWTVTPYSNYFNYLRVKFKERSVFNQATKIIATSKVTIQDFKELHPQINPDKFVYIPNGFEFEIPFRTIITSPKEKVKIGYVGSFYYSPESRDLIFQPWHKKKGHRKLQYVPRKEDWRYRSPYFFFKTLSALFLQYPELKNNVEISFAGKKDHWFDDMVREFELTRQVSHLGWLSQSESLKLQESCDFLLMTSAKVIGGKDYSIAGKTFEYFKMQKPILAFVIEGAQKNLLQESNLAYFIDPDDEEKSVNQLKRIFNESLQFHPNREFINSFHISNITKTLAETLNEIIREKK